MSFTLETRAQNAHEEAIWTADWYVPSGGDITSGKIITGALDDTVKIWNYNGSDITMEETLLGHSLGVVSVRVDHGGKTFASSSLDSNISIWEMETGVKLRSIDSGPLESWTVEFTRDSKYILTGSADGKVEMYNVDTGAKDRSLETKGKMALSLSTSPDGKWIACGGSNGLVALIDGETGNYFKTLEGHAMPVRSLAFTPDSKMLLTASDDKHVKIYALTEFQVVGTMSGHSSWVLGVSVSPDGSNFATCSSDKSVRIWDLNTKACSHVFNEAHSDQVWSIVWGSNTKLASVGEDKCINIYNMVK